MSESGSPVLLILGDAEAKHPAVPMLGVSIPRRMSDLARAAGFSRVLRGPGVQVEDAHEVTVGDPIGAPALIVFNGTYIDRRLLSLMTEHPLDPDERWGLYDEVGRPAACFAGRLASVPTSVPVCEQLDLPPGFDERSLARVVYDEDRGRAERLIVGTESGLDLVASDWTRFVEIPMLRVLGRLRATVAQLEVAALVLAVAVGGLVLIPSWFGPVLASVLLIAAVQLARLLGPLGEVGAARVEPSGDGRWAPGAVLAEVVRPVGHAAFTGAATYALVAEVDRSSVAALVILAAGALSVLLGLVQTRRLLRGRSGELFALPRPGTLLTRVGIEAPKIAVRAPLLECAMLVCALPGALEIPWGLAVLAATSRMWRWFAAPVPSEAAESDD
jgi:hypothetical protein